MFNVMEVIQNFTSRAANWYKYQPVGQMGSVYIKSLKVTQVFPKGSNFRVLKIGPQT